MKFEQFMGQVQHLAQLPTQGETARAISATLETLGERLGPNEARHLAAQLPPGVGEYLRLAKERLDYSVDDFFKRIAERQGSGVDVPAAAYHSRVVLHVLNEAVSAGEIDHVFDQLPSEFHALFEAGVAGELER